MAKKRKAGNRGNLTPGKASPSDSPAPVTASRADAPLPREAAPAAPKPPTRPSPPSPQGPAPSRLESVLAARWFLPAVLVIAALLRVAHVMALSTTPFFDNLGLDCLVYDEWAQRIAAGDWMGSRIFYQDPLYPYFLGVIYAVFGRDLMLVYLLQVGFGVATCALTAVLGRRIFGAAAGNLAGAIAALFLPSIFYEAQIEKTFLSVFLVAAFLVLVLDRRRGARVAAGAVLALAALTRANLIVFIPLGIAALLFERNTATTGRRRRAAYDFLSLPDGYGMQQAGAFLVGCLLVLAPVVLRNHHVEGQWVLTTSQAGQNFYIGNNPLNTTGSYIVPPSIRPDPRYEEIDFRAAAEKAVGRTLKPSEVSDYWNDEAWKHIRSQPEFAQMMFLRKFLLFWNDYEVPDNLNMYLLERWSWVLRLPLLGVGAIAALGILGGIVAFVPKVEVRALVVFIAIYCVTVIAFFVFSRYRIQIVPALAVLAAHGLLWLAGQLRARRWENAGGGAAAVLMTAFFCFQSFEWTDKDKAIAISLNNLAALHSQLGDTPKAIATYEEAVRLRPEGVVGAIRLLGDHYLRSGDLDRAEQYMRQVVTIKPESRMGWNALVQLYGARQARGDTDAALDARMAEALLGAGRAGEARAAAARAAAAGHPVGADLERRLQGAGS
ncbi:MAG: tetratricopeptide repeat protein [Candidatus Binatia bacterium]